MLSLLPCCYYEDCHGMIVSTEHASAVSVAYYPALPGGRSRYDNDKVTSALLLSSPFCCCKNLANHTQLHVKEMLRKMLMQIKPAYPRRFLHDLISFRVACSGLVKGGHSSFWPSYNAKTLWLEYTHWISLTHSACDLGIKKPLPLHLAQSRHLDIEGNKLKSSVSLKQIETDVYLGGWGVVRFKHEDRF